MIFSNDVPRSSLAGNVAKKFYDWFTLGMSSDAAFLAGALWEPLKRFEIAVVQFAPAGWPPLISAIVVSAFALASEPPDWKLFRIKKPLIDVANTLLVDSAVIGTPTVISG